MSLDYTINLGNVLSLVGILIGIWMMKRAEHKDNLKRLEAIEKQLDEMRKPWEMMWKWFMKEHGIEDK